MSAQLVVGVSGNLTRPSKTKVFVEQMVGQVASRIGAASATFDIQDLGSSFGQARRLAELDPSARNLVDQLSQAAVLVVGSPTFKGSYTGLFKHFFDLIDPAIVAGQAGHLGRDRRRRASFAHRRTPASPAVRFLRGTDHADRSLCLGP